jgi:hypothetical protein
MSSYLAKFHFILFHFRFSAPCIFYRLQINIPTDATNYYPLFLMFPLTLHVSGLYWPIIRGVLSCCYATIWLLPCLLAVRASVEGGLAVLMSWLFLYARTTGIEKQPQHQYGKATFHGGTDSQQARQEPNGSIATAQDTPDDGPVKARNM